MLLGGVCGVRYGVFVLVGEIIFCEEEETSSMKEAFSSYVLALLNLTICSMTRNHY